MFFLFVLKWARIYTIREYTNEKEVFFTSRPAGSNAAEYDIDFIQSIYFVTTQIYYRSVLKSLTGRVKNIQEYIEHQLTPETFSDINSKEDMNKESYQKLKNQMEEVRDIGDLRYLYTAKKNDAGKLVYVVDGLPETADDFRYPGDLIEVEIQEKLESALKGEMVLPDKIMDTDWGDIFIAYFPLHDEDEKVIGALGIELAA